MSRDTKRTMADEIIARTEEIIKSKKDRKKQANELLCIINEQRLIDHATYSDVRNDLKDCFAVLSAICV